MIKMSTEGDGLIQAIQAAGWASRGDRRTRGRYSGAHGVFWGWFVSMTRRSDAFAAIYQAGGWGGRGSGGGSDPLGARPYCEFVFDYIKDLGIESVVDVGCGDWQMWPDGAFLDGPRYVGLDVASSVVQRNLRLFGNANRTFAHMDGVEDSLPPADLMLCKEVVQHLSNDDTFALLERAIRRYPHVVICADSSMVSTSPARRLIRRLMDSVTSRRWVNSEIDAGDYRPVDLMISPFESLGFRLALEYEQVTGGRTLTTKSIWVRQPRLDEPN